MRPPPPTADEDALLTAIAAAPLDDAPRLVYADWLQDRGQDAKAEYIRAVVGLMHQHEDPAAVKKCVALADGLGADWRQAVGGRFEVVLEGTVGMQLVAFLLRMVVSYAFQEQIRPWHSGEPIRLRGSLTREDAEAFLHTHQKPMLRQMAPYDPSIKMYVRPMEADE
jgi:uncharacterized protein (TIGR02996 family)